MTFNNNETSSYVQVSAAVPQGLYELWFGYNSPFGFKGYDYQVNGIGGSGGFDGNGSQFGVDRAGVFNLTLPTNTLRINRGWGWYNVDYFELRPFTPPAILPISPLLSDELADNNTQALMNYLTSIYGQKTLAGHQHESSQNLPFPSSTYLNLSGGLKPAIRSSDFMEYSPSRIAFGANPRNESEESIAWAKANGGVMSMTWHWNAPANLVNSGEWPWWRGFYTQGTTFDLAGALANPSGSDYQLILRDIDAIAVELQKFENAGVPVIWRPLHEAQGNANGTSGNGAWFWWGADGPDAFKHLWRLMHDRLTESSRSSQFDLGVHLVGRTIGPSRLVSGRRRGRHGGPRHLHRSHQQHERRMVRRAGPLQRPQDDRLERVGHAAQRRPDGLVRQPLELLLAVDRRFPGRFHGPAGADALERRGHHYAQRAAADAVERRWTSIATAPSTSADYVVGERQTAKAART